MKLRNRQKWVSPEWTMGIATREMWTAAVDAEVDALLERYRMSEAAGPSIVLGGPSYTTRRTSEQLARARHLLRMLKNEELEIVFRFREKNT